MLRTITGVGISLVASLVAWGEPTKSMVEKIAAKPLVRAEPRYPHLEAKTLGEAWVVASFTITPEGRVSDVIIEGSQGGPRFEESTLRAMQHWRYEPATVDGQPVEQCHQDVMFTFQMKMNTDERGARPAFRRQYKKAIKSFEERDLEAFRDQIEALESTAENLYEFARIAVLRSMLAARLGDDEDQLKWIERALLSEGEFVEAALYPTLFLQQLNLQLRLQKYGEALATHRSMLEKEIEIPAELTKNVHTIESWRDQGAVFHAKVEIGPAPQAQDGLGRWRYLVVGQQPGIKDVTGQLDRMEMRCGYKRVVAREPEDKAWRIPEAWGRCWMYVYGAPGTTFSLVEYPAA